MNAIIRKVIFLCKNSEFDISSNTVMVTCKYERVHKFNQLKNRTNFISLIAVDSTVPTMLMPNWVAGNNYFTRARCCRTSRKAFFPAKFNCNFFLALCIFAGDNSF